RSEKSKRGEAERTAGKKRARRRPGEERNRREVKAKRDDSRRPAHGEARGGAIEAGFEPFEPAAHPSDGMANGAIERRRIADQRLDDRGGERERQRERERHDGGTGLDGGRGRGPLSRRRARRRPPARARRAGALDRSLDRHQSAPVSPARSRSRAVVSA